MLDELFIQDKLVIIIYHKREKCQLFINFCLKQKSVSKAFVLIFFFLIKKQTIYNCHFCAWQIAIGMLINLLPCGAKRFYTHTHTVRWILGKVLLWNAHTERSSILCERKKLASRLWKWASSSLADEDISPSWLSFCCIYIHTWNMKPPAKRINSLL